MTFPNNFGNIAFLEGISPVEYYNQLLSLNSLVQKSFAKRLAERFKSIPEVATILIPGSDGRLEAGSPLSKFELITLLNADNPVDLDLISELKRAVVDVGVSQDNLEVKGRQSVMYFVDDNPEIIQPGRVADSTLGYGEEDGLKAAKRRLANDLTTATNSRSVGPISSLIRDAKKVTETGANRIFGNDCIHFDIESGSVFYNPEARQFSFKIGPLRLVQNTILREEVKHVRATGDDDHFNNRPNPILQRIDTLKDDRMLKLDRASLTEIKEIYAFFLRLYHRSEELYRLNKQVVMQLDENEKTEVAKRLIKLRELMEKFQIKK